jgi:citrate synthase
MSETLTILDNRTGKAHDVPITAGTIRATDLQQVRTGPAEAGLMTYDPAFMNTASTRSAITFIDGDRGILWYRGYPIEQLAEHATFLEVAYLLIYGELPTAMALAQWTWQISHHTWVHENVKKFMDGFHHDAHTMSMLISAVAAISTFYPDAKVSDDPGHRDLQMYRLIGKMPTLAAFAYRHRLGQPYIYPDNDLSYAGNFLSMLFKATTELKYTPPRAVERALDVLFILHADHEQNCSTNAMRSVASSGVDPYSAVAAAALYGRCTVAPTRRCCGCCVRSVRQAGSPGSSSA